MGSGRNAIYSDAVIRRARLLHKRGYTADEIRLHLLDEGQDIKLVSIRNWLKMRDRLTPECIP